METEDVLKLREAREELVRVGFVKSDPAKPEFHHEYIGHQTHVDNKSIRNEVRPSKENRLEGTYT